MQIHYLGAKPGDRAHSSVERSALAILQIQFQLRMPSLIILIFSFLLLLYFFPIFFKLYKLLFHKMRHFICLSSQVMSAASCMRR